MVVNMQIQLFVIHINEVKRKILFIVKPYETTFLWNSYKSFIIIRVKRETATSPLTLYTNIFHSEEKHFPVKNKQGFTLVLSVLSSLTDVLLS